MKRKPDFGIAVIICCATAVIWTVNLILKIISVRELTDVVIIDAVTTAVWWAAFVINVFRRKSTRKEK